MSYYYTMTAVQQSQKLYSAIEANNLQQVITSLLEGADCEYLYSNETALTHATRLGRTDIVKCLITPSTVTSHQISYLQIEKLLLIKGADIDKLNPDGNTTLAHAVKYKNWDIVKYLISMGADICRVGTGGRTPLSWAVFDGDIEMVKYLLNNGAEFTIHSALFSAICCENLQIVQLLIQNNKKSAYLNTSNIKSGYTPLTYSIKSSNVEIVTYLLKNGSSVNKTDSNGNIPIIQSIQCKNMEIVKLLIDNGADMNVINNNGDCPLSTAVEMNNYQIVKHLLEKGLNVNSTEKNLLAVAAKNNNIAIFDCLLNFGANINSAFTELKQINTYSYDFRVYLEVLKEERRIEDEEAAQ